MVKTLLLPRTAAGLSLALCVSLPLVAVTLALWIAGPVRSSAVPSFLALAFGAGIATAWVYLRVVRPRHLPPLFAVIVTLVLGWALSWGLSFLPAMALTLPLGWAGLLDGITTLGQRLFPAAEIALFARLVVDLGVPMAALMALGIIAFTLLIESPVNRLGRRAAVVSRTALAVLAGGWLLASLLAAGNGVIAFQGIWVGSDWGRRTIAPLPDGGLEIKLCLVDRQPIPGEPLDNPDQVALCPDGMTADLRSLYTQRAAELAGPVPEEPPVPIAPDSLSAGFNTGLMTPGLTEARRTGTYTPRRLIADPDTGEPIREQTRVPVASIFPIKVGRTEINYLFDASGLPATNPVTGKIDADRYLFCFIADTYRCLFMERVPVGELHGLAAGRYVLRADNVRFGDLPAIFGPMNDVVHRLVGLRPPPAPVVPEPSEPPQ